METFGIDFAAVDGDIAAALIYVSAYAGSAFGFNGAAIDSNFIAGNACTADHIFSIALAPCCDITAVDGYTLAADACAAPAVFLKFSRTAVGKYLSAVDSNAAGIVDVLSVLIGFRIAADSRFPAVPIIVFCLQCAAAFSRTLRPDGQAAVRLYVNTIVRLEGAAVFQYQVDIARHLDTLIESNVIGNIPSRSHRLRHGRTVRTAHALTLGIHIAHIRACKDRQTRPRHQARHHRGAEQDA